MSSSNDPVDVYDQAVLEYKIVEVASSVGLEEKWVRRVLKHAITEFSEKGLGADYYGYHNIEHELDATYFTLLAAKGKSRFSYHDLYYLFVSALFHDFDPLKEFDKPNEEAIEWFLRHDPRILEFIGDAGINTDIVMALIHRTAFPFKGEIREKAWNRMQELFTIAGIPEDQLETRRHYEDLGWFLSVSERIAGYALGDFTRAMELARRNAHAVGWHPSVINVEAVKYFEIMDEEKEMVNLVLESVPREHRIRFQDNVAKFKEAFKKEMEIRDLVLNEKLTLLHVVEEMPAIGTERRILVDPDLKKDILRLNMLLPPPIRVHEKEFHESLMLNDTLLVTLRTNTNEDSVVGYAKGGPLERYSLRSGTFDENIGRRNTIYLEPISIEPEYWGANGGHLLRRAFLKEAKERDYRFVSGYAHRNVIERRIARGEPVKIVCKYDPDKRDYYRMDLAELSEEDLLVSSITSQLQGSMQEERNI